MGTKESRHSVDDKTKKYKVKREGTSKKTGKKKGKTKGNGNHPMRKKILKICLILFALLVIVGVGVVAGIFFFGSNITKAELLLGTSNSVVQDIDGETITVLNSNENRKVVNLSEMGEYLPKAFVSIEDERFYEHHGVDIKRTLGATVTYITHFGKSSFGGSTITQQLVKNKTNDKRDSPIRKIKEMCMAYKAERMLSKDEILQSYLNTIYLGGGGKNICGVEMAAQYYFAKPANELSLAQSAYIAGITHTPNTYDPFKEEPNTDKIKTRTKTVLGKMKELGKIDEAQYTEAVQEVEDGLAFQKGEIAEQVYSYHTEAAINQIINQLVEEKEMDREYAKTYIESNGFIIHSTQDSSIQNRMEEEYEKDTYIKKGRQKDKDGNLINDHTQSAMVIIDHKTGNVVGTVGGLGEKTVSGNLNRATQSTRQTGSAMKPISTIAPAIQEKIITAGTVYDDSKTKFGSYTPKNDNDKYRGLITVRDAIGYSQNMVPLKIMTELTPGKSIDYLRKMGVTSLYKHGEDKKKDDESLPLAIGGISDGISPLEVAGAYATIANDGEYITPTFYTKVTDMKGNTILEPKQEKRRVFSEESAYVVKSILTQPVLSGTATYCKISGMDVAAKTGTTNSNNDRWLCGFTPYYTAATWFGYDQLEEVKWSGTNPAGLIWSNIMKDVHKGLDKASFERPAGIVTATICKKSGMLATDKCLDTYTEVFVKGTQPTKKCEGHITLTICKTTGKIANEYCPETEERTYTAKPEKEQKAKWDTDYGGKFDIVTDHCTIHTKPEEKPEEKPKEEPNTNTSKPGNNTIDKPVNNTVDGGNTNTTKPENNTTDKPEKPEANNVPNTTE